MISVMMPVYNASAYIEKSITSILNQTFQDFELLIVNDGSTDNSEEIIHSFMDPRIRYFYQDNRGVGSARNIALQASRGEFLAFQDADDISLPHRLQTLYRNFFSAEVGIVHSDMLLINSADNVIGYLISRQIEPQMVMWQIMARGTPFNNPSMMVRKKVFGTKKFNEELTIGEDTDIVSSIAVGCYSIHISEPLYLYRRHENNSDSNVNYDQVIKHIRTILTHNDLQTLFPEIVWSNNDDLNAFSRSVSILALYLAQQGKLPDAQYWLQKANNMQITSDTTLFVVGIGNLIIKNYSEALKYLQMCQQRDHVVCNYIGECYAYLGDTQTAFAYFLKAIEMSPGYYLPSQNLKGLGGSLYMLHVDSYFKKFI